MSGSENTHDAVRKAYGEVARGQTRCCGAGNRCGGKPATVSDHPVPQSDLGLSCGNPLAFGHIREGDVVLDLGSGAGKDVFLAAQQVGATGRAIGLDVTPEMLTLARENTDKFTAATGLTNVEFRQGPIEDLPVADASVDVVISNCVINLSPDKPQVFREVYRVLRPGGKMIVADIVLNRPLPPAIRDDANLYVACIAGALLRNEYLQAIRAAGFQKVEILSDHTYQACNASDDLITSGMSDVLAGVAASITVVAIR